MKKKVKFKLGKLPSQQTCFQLKV